MAEWFQEQIVDIATPTAAPVGNEKTGKREEPITDTVEIPDSG